MKFQKTTIKKKHKTKIFKRCVMKYVAIFVILL
jgi:hypothetical protein